MLFPIEPILSFQCCYYSPLRRVIGISGSEVQFRDVLSRIADHPVKRIGELTETGFCPIGRASRRHRLSSNPLLPLLFSLLK
jgi:hypothetical protein